MNSHTGPVIPAFTILAIAGRGGMATVYRAEQHVPRRIVALKMLRRAGEDNDLAAFRQEAQTIAALEHPYIVPLYAFGEHESVPYLALRYLDGGTVAQRIARGPIALDTAARWIASVGDALDFAHQAGIVHRDVKPSNILLDSSDNAYLTDFGIAGAFTTATSGLPTGSAAYMPPEQGRGEPVDGRGDIYSLSVTLFEMLTGRKPYVAESVMGVIVRHLNDPIPSARELNPSIPPAVDELIQWGMAKSPDERPQKASEFVRLLKHALAQPNQPIRAVYPSGPADPTVVAGPTVVAARPKTQSSALIWIGAAALAAVLCIGGLAVTLGGGVAAWIFGAEATPLLTATKLPTLTPLPTPTPTPQGQLLFDDFSSAGSGFAVTRQDDPDGSVTYAQGVLQITVLTKGFEWFSPSGRVNAPDVALQATVRQQSGPTRNEMAVVCRWQDSDNYTAFAISGDGLYSIWEKQGGAVKPLVDWAPDSSLTTGAGVTHTLRATCNGSSLRFEVDGALLGQAIDSEPGSGDVAVMAGLTEEGALVVEFDEVRVITP